MICCSPWLKNEKRRTIFHSLLYNTSNTICLREGELGSIVEKASQCKKNHGSQKTFREIRLGYFCRDAIQFRFVFTVSSWCTQKFTVPVALWGFWWIPNPPQELPHVNVKSVQRGIVLWWELKQKSACFWGFLPWCWLFLGSGVAEVHPLPQTPDELMEGQQGRAALINHICHFYACWALREESFCPLVLC